MPPQETSADNLAVRLEYLAAAGRWADRPAFHTPDRTWTHAEVHQGARAAAVLLAAAGIGIGDRILVVTSDRIEFVWAFLGAARVGATAILVNPLLPASDHEFMVQDCEPALAVCDDHLASRFQPLTLTLTAEAMAETIATIAGPLDRVPATEVTQDFAAYAQYTSGTTGRPKAALHRHSDPAGYHAAMGEGVLGLTPADVVLSVSKSYFAYGLGNSVLFPLSSGAAAILDPDKPTVDRVASAVARHGATVMFAVPSFYARLVAEGDATAFATLRVAVCAGETLQPALHQRATGFLGCELLDGLGSTEAGQTFISNSLGRSRAGTIGTVLTGYQASVRGEHGESLPAGRTGSLWVKGATLMLGYLNRRDETAAALVDGWCRTGDRASIDADGYFHHHGRLDDMEIVGGMNVSPLEVEAVLLEHPAVAEVAVASIFDSIGASRLRCFVVPDPRVTWGDAIETEILDLARRRLAAFKVPRSVTPVAALPRTATGKLRRHILRGGWPPPEDQESVS